MKKKKVLMAVFLGAVFLLTSNVPVFASNGMLVYSEKADIQATNETYAIVNQDAYMYTSKYFQGNVVCSVPQGAIVEIRSEGLEWCRIKYNHQIGYIETRCLNFQF